MVKVSPQMSITLCKSAASNVEHTRLELAEDEGCTVQKACLLYVTFLVK